MPDIKLFVEAPGSSLLIGLNAYYALEGLTDSTYNASTLTNNGGVTFPAGKVGNAANFVSASSQYLSVADGALFQMGTGDITVACWVKSSNIASQKVVFYGAGNTAGYGIAFSGNGLVGSIAGGGKKSTPVTNFWNDALWHLAVATFSRSGNATLYVDNAVEGAVDIRTANGSVNNAAGFNIGAQSGAAFLDGSVDEVGIWNRVLNDAEIATLWNGGAGRTHPFL